MTSAGHSLFTPPPHSCTHTSLHSAGLLHLTPFGLLLPPQRSLARSWRGESGFWSSSTRAREAVQPPPRALQRRLCPMDRQTAPQPSSPGQGESKSGAWALQIQGRHRDQRVMPGEAGACSALTSNAGSRLPGYCCGTSMTRLHHWEMTWRVTFQVLKPLFLPPIMSLPRYVCTSQGCVFCSLCIHCMN